PWLGELIQVVLALFKLLLLGSEFLRAAVHVSRSDVVLGAQLLALTLDLEKTRAQTAIVRVHFIQLFEDANSRTPYSNLGLAVNDDRLTLVILDHLAITVTLEDGSIFPDQIDEALEFTRHTTLAAWAGSPVILLIETRNVAAKLTTIDRDFVHVAPEDVLI